MLSAEEEGDVMELMTSWEKKGLEKGLEVGREKERMAEAKNMLQKRADERFILEVTGLSKEDLDKIKSELQ